MRGRPCRPGGGEEGGRGGGGGYGRGARAMQWCNPWPLEIIGPQRHHDQRRGPGAPPDGSVPSGAPLDGARRWQRHRPAHAVQAAGTGRSAAATLRALPQPQTPAPLLRPVLFTILYRAMRASMQCLLKFTGGCRPSSGAKMARSAEKHAPRRGPPATAPGRAPRCAARAPFAPRPSPVASALGGREGGAEAPGRAAAAPRRAPRPPHIGQGEERGWRSSYVRMV
jgi:hypothetical protein